MLHTGAAEHEMVAARPYHRYPQQNRQGQTLRTQVEETQGQEVYQGHINHIISINRRL